MRWSLTSGPIKWVGRRQARIPHTPSPPPHRARAKKEQAQPEKKAQPNERNNRRACVCIAVEHRYNNKRNSSSSNVLDNHLATYRDLLQFGTLPDQSLHSLAAAAFFFISIFSSPFSQDCCAKNRSNRVRRLAAKAKRTNSLGNSSSLRCLEPH